MKQKPSSQWSSLDNAAKIFPCTSNKRDTKVFRFICELVEPVRPDLLQQALDRALEDFPIYRSVMAKGLFWYYLERTDRPALVQPEQDPPCARLYDRNVKSLLFQVSYHHCRINLEMYHALADGTGGMTFFRTMVCYYLGLCQGQACVDCGPLTAASSTQKEDDSFQKYYTGGRSAPTKGPKAYRIRGAKTAEDRLKVIGGAMPVDAVIKLAHAHGTTVTLFLAALLLCSVEKSMSEKDKRHPVVTAVPVDLRRYFPSQTIRNFFSVVNVGVDFRQVHGLEEVAACLDEQLKSALTRENLERRLNKLMALERNPAIRLIPLALKDPVMRFFYRLSDNACTVSLSNLGRVDLPEPFRAMVRQFEVFVSTDKLQMCVCSYGNTLCADFSSAFAATDVQMEFFRSLTAMGVPVEISANRFEEE